MICVYKYNDVREILTSSDFVVEYPFRISKQILGETLLDIDGERHVKLRELIAPLFRNTSISKLDSLFDQSQNRIFQDMEGKTSINFMDECAKNIPLQMICKYIGIFEKDVNWVYDKLMYLSDHLDGSAGDFEKASLFRDELRDYVENIVLTDANEGIVSSYLQSLGNSINMKEKVSLIMLLLAAGVETSMSTIGNVMVCLLNHQKIMDAVNDNPSFVCNVIRESIRWEPPQHSTVRFAKCDVNISGVAINKGAPIKLVLASANRDEDIYKNSEIFDPYRKDFQNASFGFGKHACIGRRFATTVIEKFFMKFFTKYKVELSGDSMPNITGMVFRKPENIYLNMYPRSKI